MKKQIFASIVTFALVAVMVSLAWVNRFAIYDWIKLRGYTPPAQVAQLAEETSFNSYGKRLFYINSPQISDKQQFAAQCKVREQTIVLGCYNGTHIYVYQVDDPKLNGVEQVTAAHEMLHAAYDRLGGSEKTKIDALLMTAYNRLNDKRLQDLIASYETTEPGQTANELHSILGTEQRNLGPELEEYYKKYFIDRTKVVTYAENYQKVFDTLKNQVDTYDAELSLRKSEIERRQTALEIQSDKLAAQKIQMDQQKESGQVDAYNAQVASYNNGVKSYNAEIITIQGLINEYNALVIIRNNVTIEQQNLAKSIDSRPTTISN